MHQAPSLKGHNSEPYFYISHKHTTRSPSPPLVQPLNTCSFNVLSYGRRSLKGQIHHVSTFYVSFAFPCAAAAPVKADDAWGSPAPPSGSSPSSDPFGDGPKKDDAWGALSNTPSNEQGKRIATFQNVNFLLLFAH